MIFDNQSLDDEFYAACSIRALYKFFMLSLFKCNLLSFFVLKIISEILLIKK